MSDFLAAFALFGDAWTAALLLSALLPFLGVVLVARQQVFLGAAAGQAATFGLAVASFVGVGHAAHPGHLHAETLALVFALLAGAAVGGSSMRALTRSASGLEARNAWVFLVGGGGSVLLLSRAPHGLQEVQRLHLSSLLGASPTDKWVAAGALLLTLAAVLGARRRLALWAFDPDTARALGERVARLDLGVGAWLGCCLGFAIHVAGLLFAFGLAVLPVLVAREVARSLRSVLLLAPVVGLSGCALGLFLAHEFDLPPGQVTVALLGVLLPLAWSLGRLRGAHGRR